MWFPWQKIECKQEAKTIKVEPEMELANGFEFQSPLPLVFLKEREREMSFLADG